MKILVIFTDTLRFEPFNPFYERYYRILTHMGADFGVRVILTVSYDYDLVHQCFRRGYTITDAWYDETYDIVPDGIWYKSSQINALTYRIYEDYRDIFINPLEFVLLARDKYLTAKVFPKISPATYMVPELTKNTALLASLVDPAYIAKPNSGNSGRGVERIERENLDTYLKNASEDTIIQAVIDSSCGIPGLTDGIHDLRVNVVGTTMQFLTLRMPKKGDFRCNIALGGGCREFGMDTYPIPPIFLESYRNLIAWLPVTRGIYSIDCVLASDGRVYLGEFNSSPGISIEGETPEEEVQLLGHFYTAIFQLFGFVG